MSTFDALVDDVQRSLYGYGLSQPRAAFLTTAIDADDTQIVVGDAEGFEQGVAEIGNETVFIESVDYASKVLTIAPDGRGYYGTTAAAHAINARATMAPIWSRGQVASAVNDAILGTYPQLFGIASTTFTYNPAISTYAVPAAADAVLRVSADVIGPSNERPVLSRWSFDPIRNTITLEQAAQPGQTVYVSYSTTLTEITFGDDFTDSGLQETARLAIKYAACSSLIAFLDPARLPVDTAVADEYDPSRHAVGNATKISGQLYQRYLIELDNERKRLRAVTKTPVSVRTR